MDKTAMLSEIRARHAELTALVASMDEQQLTRRDVYDGLSVKDVLAHIVAWERMMVRWLVDSRRGETPDRFAPGFVINQDDSYEVIDDVINRLNAKVYEENKDRSLADVMADFQAAHTEVLDALEDASEDELFDPNRFAWRQGSPFINAVESNTYGHYQEHIDLVRAWLNSGKQG
jgi:hypothetical protein